ncbi:hypothetical protein YC2023_010699 [Brassica napus]
MQMVNSSPRILKNSFRLNIFGEKEARRSSTTMPSSNGVTKQRRKFSEIVRRIRARSDSKHIHKDSSHCQRLHDCRRKRLCRIWSRPLNTSYFAGNAYFGCSSECSTPKEHLKRLAMPTSANENIMPDPKDSHNIEGQPPLYAAAENMLKHMDLENTSFAAKSGLDPFHVAVKKPSR